MKKLLTHRNVELFSNILCYNCFKIFGIPKKLPVFLTINVNDLCNSRCRICNIWKNDSEKKVKEQLKLWEFERIFKNYGNLYWVTITGGEPFLRKDLVEVVKTIYNNTRPLYLTITTNGMVRKKILKDVASILENCPHMNLIINVSIDGKEKDHDFIRGVKGSYRLAKHTIKDLKSIESEKLIVGVNTVISKYNVKNFENSYKHILKAIEPDSFIFEIAENRAKLYNNDLDISPDATHKQKALDFLIENTNIQVGDIIPNLRKMYYESLYERRFHENFEGIASGYIMSNGEVRLSDSMKLVAGNVRNLDYNFRRIWFSKRAEAIRVKMKKGYCSIISNAFYVNYLCNIKNLPEFIFSVYFR